MLITKRWPLPGSNTTQSRSEQLIIRQIVQVQSVLRSEGEAVFLNLSSEKGIFLERFRTWLSSRLWRFIFYSWRHVEWIKHKKIWMTGLSLGNFTCNNTNPGPHLSHVISVVKSSVNTAKTGPSCSLQGVYYPVFHQGILLLCWSSFFSRMWGRGTTPSFRPGVWEAVSRPQSHLTAHGLGTGEGS